jgi:hypothetical protein
MPYGIDVIRISPTSIMVSDGIGQLAILANMTVLEAKNAVRIACDKHDQSDYITELRMSGIVGQDELCRTFLRHTLLNF